MRTSARFTTTVADRAHLCNTFAQVNHGIAGKWFAQRSRRCLSVAYGLLSRTIERLQSDAIEMMLREGFCCWFGRHSIHAQGVPLRANFAGGWLIGTSAIVMQFRAQRSSDIVFAHFWP